jgi:hypothetical protein
MSDIQKALELDGMLLRAAEEKLLALEAENAALREDAERVPNLHLAAVNLYLAGAAELEAENAALRELLERAKGHVLDVIAAARKS